MILPIRTLGDPVLKTPAKPVDGASTEAPARSPDDMIETMYRRARRRASPDPRSVISLRLFVFDDGETGPSFMANPELSDASGEVLIDEGCLSIPGPFHPTTRSTVSPAAGRTSTGRPCEIDRRGAARRSFQHETDHLDGRCSTSTGSTTRVAGRCSPSCARSSSRSTSRGSAGASVATPTPEPGDYPRRMTRFAIAFLGQRPVVGATPRGRSRRGVDVVALVVTNPPRPAGRGSRLAATAVAEAARTPGCRSRRPPGYGRVRGSTCSRRSRPDVIVVVAYGELLTVRRLSTCPVSGCVNLHFSLLPRWRGAAPVQRADPRGRRRHRRTRHADGRGPRHRAGPRGREEPIRPEDDAGSLGAAARADRRSPCWSRLLPRLAAGGVEPTAQDPAAVYAAKIRPKERELDWTRSASSSSDASGRSRPSPARARRSAARSLKILRARRS